MMKGLYSVEQDTIVSYGVAYENMGVADSVYDIPDDYTPDRYRYVSITPGTFNPNGFTPISSVSVDFIKRQSNVNAMSQYMTAVKDAGGITQANLELFLSDTAAFVPAYVGGSSRLITWIETVNRNGYNAKTVGFKTKTGYCGTLLSGTAGALGEYQRATDILAILNNL